MPVPLYCEGIAGHRQDARATLLQSDALGWYSDQTSSSGLVASPKVPGWTPHLSIMER